MSYTTLYVMPQSGSVEEIQEFRNSHGFASFVWDAMQKKYLPGRHWMFKEQDAQAVWNLWMDDRCEDAERYVMRITFDRSVIEFSHAHEAVKHLRRFCELHADHGRENHLPAIADEIEKYLTDPGDGLPPVGFCFYPMSVSEDLWQVHVPIVSEDDDEEDEDYECRGFDYSIDLHDDICWVFTGKEPELFAAPSPQK